jgi:uncharacterized protein (DUF2384 family)
MASIALQGICLSSPIGCWSAAHRCSVARANQVLGRATGVLGARQSALDWLTRPAYGLDWCPPCQLLADADGYLQVIRYLARIEYGVY